MDVNLGYILALIVLVAASSVISFLFSKRKILQDLQKKEASTEEINSLLKDLVRLKGDIKHVKMQFETIDQETRTLQDLKINADKIAAKLKLEKEQLGSKEIELTKINDGISSNNSTLHKLISKIDLYTAQDEFIEQGFFEIPSYLHSTSARFAVEIKRIRDEQKSYIKEKKAVTDCMYSDHPKKFINIQRKLILKALNIESDILIGKVSPSTYERTLVRIEKVASDLEKTALEVGLSIDLDYVELKLKECQLQYEFTLKKADEKEEQRLIREQMREEVKATKEFERAIKAAKEEELLYQKLLNQAKQELSQISDEEKAIAEQKITLLESQLVEAQQKEQRAKSMAEQTRKGHVYVISNIGSFGENIYKIGLTRRLEPLDRVKELGDASVPFIFDVHAMIYVDDAPALERALHNKFTSKRVNAVNMRKEFFNIELQEIKQAVSEIAGLDAEFTTTAVAQDYYETQRLSGNHNSTVKNKA